MSEFGFRIAVFALTSTKDVMTTLPLDYPVIGSGGALSTFKDALNGLREQGGVTDSADHYQEVTAVMEQGYCLVVNIQGGGSGDEFDVINATYGPKGSISADDALTWHGRMIFVFPPGGCSEGMIIYETRGNSAHFTVLHTRLERELRRTFDLKMNTRTDIADGVAWKAMFDQQRSHVHSVEFAVADPAMDGTNFTEDSSVSKVRVEYQLTREGNAEKKTIDIITGVREGKTELLLNAVGGERYSELTHEDPVANIVTDGRMRKYRVGKKQSRFTRIIESPTKLDDNGFKREIAPAVLETYAAMGINLPMGWLPLDED